MAVRVNLAPGMEGINMGDGVTRYHDKPGGAVTVSDEHAAYINKMGGNGDAGLIDGRNRAFLGTRKGQWCASCRRLWQGWTLECPKCHGPNTEVAPGELPPLPPASRA